MSSRSLNSRVVASAVEALARQGFVTPVDVCLGLGWLHASNYDRPNFAVVTTGYGSMKNRITAP